MRPCESEYIKTILPPQVSSQGNAFNKVIILFLIC